MQREREKKEGGGRFFSSGRIYSNAFPGYLWGAMGSGRELGRGRTFSFLTLSISAWFDFTLNNKNIFFLCLKEKSFKTPMFWFRVRVMLVIP